jgi:hypothetical protein
MTGDLDWTESEMRFIRRAVWNRGVLGFGEALIIAGAAFGFVISSIIAAVEHPEAIGGSPLFLAVIQVLLLAVGSVALAMGISTMLAHVLRAYHHYLSDLEREGRYR